MGVGEGKGWDGGSVPYPQVVLHIVYEPPTNTKPRTLSKVGWVGGGGGGGGGWVVVVVKRYFRVPFWSKTWT